jgi:hypothetical protein
LPVSSGYQPRPIDDCAAIHDIAWLERIASSAAFAQEVQRGSPLGMAKLLRGAAYARWAPSGTAESLAAVGRIERSMDVTLTPATVPLGVWPSVSWHMRDVDQVPMATAVAPDGTTYAVVAASLLGGFESLSDLDPDARRIRSRGRGRSCSVRRRDAEGDRTASLAFRGPATLVLATSGTEMQVRTPTPSNVTRTADGWTDVEEGRIGTNPHAPDSDDDSVPDGRRRLPAVAAAAAMATRRTTRPFCNEP